MFSFMFSISLFILWAFTETPYILLASALFAISGNICMAKDEFCMFNRQFADKIKDVVSHIRNKV